MLQAPLTVLFLFSLFPPVFLCLPGSEVPRTELSFSDLVSLEEIKGKKNILLLKGNVELPKLFVPLTDLGCLLYL